MRASPDAATPRARVLVLLEDRRDAERLRGALAGAGLAVSSCSWRDAAGAASRQRPDAVVIVARDQALTELSACAAISRDWRMRDVPILVLLAAQAPPEAALACFSAGADHCVRENEDPRVVAAQVAALIRRRARSPRIKRQFRAAGLTLDYGTRSVRVKDREVLLTPKEFAILEKLMRGSGEAVPRAALMDSIRRPHEETSTHALETHVANLRRKLGKLGPLIRTHARIGYRLAEDD